jgi:hypothetical protein
MAACRAVFAAGAGTSVGTCLDDWRFSRPYPVRTVKYEGNAVVVELFPTNSIIKFPIELETVCAILACRRRFITTFRFHPGKLARIDGFADLNPSFPVDSSEKFDVTLSNQSENIPQLVGLATSCGTWGGYHPDQMCKILMPNFLLEDQGMVLIYGPLPSGKLTYPAHILKDTSASSAPKADLETGFGLIFRVKDSHVLVQYGNGIHMLDRSELKSKYNFYETGLPTAVESSDHGESSTHV